MLDVEWASYQDRIRKEGRTVHMIVSCVVAVTVLFFAAIAHQHAAEGKGGLRLRRLAVLAAA